MKVTRTYSTTGGEKLHIVSLTSSEAKLYSEEFENFKSQYKGGELPFGFRDSRGKMVDGKIKAKTEEEYNRKAKKFIKDHEEKMYGAKRFSLAEAIDSAKMVHSWGNNRRRLVEYTPSDSTYYKSYLNPDGSYDNIESGEYGRIRKIKEKAKITRKNELSPKAYKKAYKLIKENNHKEDDPLTFDEKGRYKYKDIQRRQKELDKESRELRQKDPDRKGKGSYRSRDDESGYYETKIDPKTRKAIGKERKIV